MRAVILAGGKGTRLRPFTVTVPKPLVPIGDMAIMEVVVKQLADAGFHQITVSVGHLAQLIMAYFGDGKRWGIDIDYSMEEEPLGTIGPLKLINDLPENFLVMNGDVLSDIDYAAVYKHHVESGNVGTITTYGRRVKIDFGVIRYDSPDNRVVGFTEKPTEFFSVCMGVNVLNRDVLDFVPDNTYYGFDDLMSKLITDGARIHAYPFDGYWLDIGRPDDYERANREFDIHRDRFLSRESDGDV